MRKLILCLVLSLYTLSVRAGLFSMSHQDRVEAIVEAFLPATMYQQMILFTLEGAARGSRIWR